MEISTLFTILRTVENLVRKVVNFIENCVK